MSIVAKDKYYIASCLPAWPMKSAGMDEIRAAREKYFPSQLPDPYFTAGYVHGAITHAVLLAAIKRGDLSRAGINTAVKDVGTTDLNGLLTHTVDFSKPPQERFPRAIQVWDVNAIRPELSGPGYRLLHGRIGGKLSNAKMRLDTPGQPRQLRAFLPKFRNTEKGDTWI